MEHRRADHFVAQIELAAPARADQSFHLCNTRHERWECGEQAEDEREVGELRERREGCDVCEAGERVVVAVDVGEDVEGGGAEEEGEGEVDGEGVDWVAGGSDVSWLRFCFIE
jgi:hypothetical protein